jgi:hypothetical protein
MFERFKAVRKLRRHMALHQAHRVIVSLCGYAPYSVCLIGDTPYAVIISRGDKACPLVEFGGHRDYERLKQKYRGEVKERGYRGYHVSVDKVERLNL